MRVRELVAMRIADIDLDRGGIQIGQGKTFGRERVETADHQASRA